MRSFLRERRVIHNEPGIFSADHPIRLGEQNLRERRCVPNTVGHEMVKLVIADPFGASRQRLDARAVPGTNQPAT